LTASDQAGFDYDLAIVGAGMVGGALACALGQKGFRIALIEQRAPDSNWSAEQVDLRVSALTRASQRILENLGVWHRMMEMRVTPYRGMLVWDSSGSGSIRFDAAEIGEPDLGHIVENRVTQLALWECLCRLESVVRFCPASVQRLQLGEAGPWLELDNGKRIRAQLIVAADGAHSKIRELAAITSSGWSYDQHAVVATVRPEKHHGDIARQRFMPNGPLALLPIDNGCCSIVWSTAPEHADHLLQLDDGDFCQQLESASQGVLGAILEVGPRGRFPLALRHADRYVSEGLALVGDAAHGIHPLAGQGVNLGFLDAAVLAETLLDSRKGERPLGALARLRRYERTRKGHNLEMLALMDLFKRFFSNDNQPLAVLRNFGLNLVDAMGPLKRALVRRAMGMTGELPELAEHLPEDAFAGPGSSAASPGYPRR